MALCRGGKVKADSEPGAVPDDVLRGVLGVLPDVVYVYDLVEHRNRFASREILSLLGYTPEEVASLGPSFLADNIHPDDLPRVAGHHATLAAAPKGETHTLRYRIRHRDGAWRWLESRDAPFERVGDRTVSIVGRASDVTAEMVAEEALRASEERYRLLAQHGRDVVGSHDPASRVYTYVSPASEPVLGWAPHALLGSPLSSYAHPDDVATMGRALDGGEELGISAPITYRFRRPDGSFTWVETIFSPVTAAGATLALVSGTREVTERVRLEQRLRAHAAELEASNERLEHFAVAASHDLKEPLRKVTLFIQLLREQLGPDLTPPQDESMGIIEAGAEQMHHRLTAMLDLARTHATELNLSLVDMNGLVDEIFATLMEPAEVPTPTLARRDLPRVQGDRDLLMGLLTNLIGNATRFRHPDRVPNVEVAFCERTGRFEVSDNGMGVPEAHRATIFEPFRRLVRQSEVAGHGMGLAISRSIVQRHGGQIGIVANPTGGSIFWFSLPRGAHA